MFADKIKEARKNLGYTQEQFAKAIMASRSTVRDMETGKNKGGNLSILQKICEVTNKPAEYYLDDVEITMDTFEPLKMMLDSLVKTGSIRKGQPIKKDDKKLLDVIYERCIQSYLEDME